MASQMTETLRNRTLFEVWLHLLFAVPSSPQSQIMIVEWRHSQTVIVKRLRTSLLSNKRDLMPENDSAKNQTEYNSERADAKVELLVHFLWYFDNMMGFVSSHWFLCNWPLSEFDCVCWILQHKVLRAEVSCCVFQILISCKSFLLKCISWSQEWRVENTKIILGLADLFTSGYLKDDRIVKF